MKIIRSNRKTLCLCINRQGEPEVRAPYGASRAQIDRFVAAHQEWLQKKLAAYRPPKEYTPAQMAALRKAAQAYFPPRVAAWAKVMGLSPAGVRITAAKTRYGSCSPKGGLCFSLFLMEKSEAAREAVIVHELAHLVRRDHSAAFYEVVCRYLPDYQQRIKELKV